MNLVTGATGFLGSYIVRKLVKNNEKVRVIFRPGSDKSLLKGIEDRIEWAEADLLDVNDLETAFEGIKKVYHSAAVVSFYKSDREILKKTNVKGTVNIVNECIVRDIDKLVFISSVAAVGRSKRVQTLNEKNRWENHKYNSNYAISKFRAENEVWRGIGEGLNAVIVNPSTILGAGFWNRGTGKIFDRVFKGLKFSASGKTGFVDVRDVAEISYLLMNSDISGQRFITSSENRYHSDILKLIAENMDKKPPKYIIGPKISGFAWRIDAIIASILGRKPLISREIAVNMSNEYSYQNEKISDALGFTFRPVNDTLQETAALYLSSGGKTVVFPDY